MKENRPNIGFLFDLDGVLLDSEREYSRIWSKIEEHYPTGVENFDKVIKGTTLDNIIATYFGAPEVCGPVRKMLYELEGAMHYQYCPGAEEMLKDLKSRGIPVALFTSSDKVKMEHVYTQHPELKGYFDVIIDGTMVSKSKPDPEGYLLAAERLGVDPTRCVVVEDSVQGVKAGRGSGALVAGIAGTLPAEKLTEWADIIADGVENLDYLSIIDILSHRGS